MSLDSLKELTHIGGYDVYSDDKIADGKWSDVHERFCICVHHGDNTISFRLQNGPPEDGVNGCEVDALLLVAKKMLQAQNKKEPNARKACALNYLNDVLMHLDASKL